MGGGGGSYRSDPERMMEQLRKSEEKTKDREFESQVNQYLSSLLPEVNDRDTDAINLHLEQIGLAFEKELDRAVDLLFGGSVAKHTYVDGLSDIDSLVVLDRTELVDEPPNKAIEFFLNRLSERFPGSDVKSGRLAVTIEFSDSTIQLLPALRAGDKIMIPDRTGKGWSKIEPDKFREALTSTNEKSGNKLVPVIKLAKAIISSLPDQHQVSGYHAEALAVEAFRKYDKKLQIKPMLQHFFNESRRLVLQPIADDTGQSIHVDDYLGSGSSPERRTVASAFDRIRRRMRIADVAISLDEWKSLFD